MDINNFTFGVELELYTPVGMSRSGVAQALTAAGITCREESYGHSVPSSWKIITDGSLADYTRGGEVVSPILRGEEGFATLRKVCDTLVRIGCSVNRQCGFHVHVGVRNESVDFFKHLARIYGQYENVIDQLLAPSRRGGNNTFCKALRLQEDALQRALDVRGVARAIGAGYNGDDRFMKVNFQSWFRQGTVEFRQHQGTLDADKAIAWVRLCLRICARAKLADAANPAPVASPVARSRDRHLQTVIDMLLRPEGTTREEIMAATGQRGARIPRRSRAAGLNVVRRRRGNTVRFYATRPQATPAGEYPISLEGLMALVAADQMERSYFAARVAALA